MIELSEGELEQVCGGERLTWLTDFLINDQGMEYRRYSLVDMDTKINGRYLVLARVDDYIVQAAICGLSAF